MAVYELTLRFEAEDDDEALAFAIGAEQTVKGDVERLTRIVVTHMPLSAAQARAAGEPC